MTIRQNGLDEHLYLVSMSEVRSVYGSASSESANLILRSGVAAIALYEHYIGSGFGQRDCHGFSNTPRGTCDQSNSAV